MNAKSLQGTSDFHQVNLLMVRELYEDEDM